MTKAASLLNVAQPALGLQIRQLEELLGTPLLERHSRGVSTTPAGDLLYERALAILAMFEAAERDVTALGKSRRETIALGITPSIMRLVGADLIQAAKRDLPEVHFSLVEEPSTTIIRALEAGELDIALTYEVPDTAPITKIAAQVEELIFVTRAGKAPPENPISVETVLAHDLVLASERDPIRRMVETAAARAETTVSVAYEVQSLLATRQVVIDGLAASILPYGVVADELKAGVLESRNISGLPFRRTLYIARPDKRGAFANEDGVMRLMRAVVKQLTIDLGDLATQPSEEVADA